jgi:hypothetical protein
MLPRINTSFLYSIHITYHVRIREKSIEKEELSQGVGQLTPVIEKTASDLFLGVQEVRDHHREYRRYI